MTTDEAIEALGSLVAEAGGRGDDALDHIKDELSRLEAELDAEKEHDAWLQERAD